MYDNYHFCRLNFFFVFASPFEAGEFQPPRKPAFRLECLLLAVVLRDRFLPRLAEDNDPTLQDESGGGVDVRNPVSPFRGPGVVQPVFTNSALSFDKEGDQIEGRSVVIPLATCFVVSTCNPSAPSAY